MLKEIHQLIGRRSTLPDPAETKQLLARYHDDAELAQRAFFHFNGDSRRTRRSFHPKLIARATEFGYLKWPRRLASDIRDKDVLDVGCGTGQHAIGYIVAGCRSYTGIDPIIKLDDDYCKNLRKKNKDRFGWTPRQIMDLLPDVAFHSGELEEMEFEAQFDVAVLHNVTEHLVNIEDVFERIWRALRPNGVIIFVHHNFYAWNGHHRSPKTVSDIDPDDEEQKQYVDWAHLSFDPPPGHYFLRGLNRIRLDDLRRLTDRYFNVFQWEEKPSDEDRGRDRLTPEIEQRYPQYTRRELTVQNVTCRAIRRDVPGPETSDGESDQRRSAAPTEQEGAVAWRAQDHDVVVPDDLPDVPGMISEHEAAYLYWLTSQQYTGRGAVVEVGTWLGRSSIHLGAGLKDWISRHGRNDAARLHCYDRFEWLHGMESKADLPLKPGDDFKPYFEANVRPVFPDVHVTASSLSDIRWTGGPIEVLFLDAPKRLREISEALAIFGPSLIPGVSRIVMQDYLHFPSYALAMVTDELQAQLEPTEAVAGSATLTFRVTGDLSGFAAAQPVRWNFHELDPDEALERWETILARLPYESRLRLASGGAMMLHDLGATDRALQYLQDLPMSGWVERKWEHLARQKTLYVRYYPLFAAQGLTGLHAGVMRRSAIKHLLFGRPPTGKATPNKLQRILWRCASRLRR